MNVASRGLLQSTRPILGTAYASSSVGHWSANMKRSVCFCQKGSVLASVQQHLAAPQRNIKHLGRFSQTARHLSKTARRAAVDAAPNAPVRREDVITGKPGNNVSDHVFKRMGVNLHLREDHPLAIIKAAIYEYMDKAQAGTTYRHFDDLYPIVSAQANFDDVLVPADHVSRGTNDTFYVDPQTVLRCHTSAHQAELLRQGHTAFLVTGDVYRRDTVDATHYPVFHQMEAVRIFQPSDWEAAGKDAVEFLVADLKATLDGLARHLFGQEIDIRWVDAYFPFTGPSFEMEIFFRGEWLEVLGCGVMQQAILDSAGQSGNKGWAFGLGLERLAMVLFQIPDIRLFWSEDDRFLQQFKAGNLAARFKPYSKFPPCFKDVSFWTNDEFTENNLCEIVRDVAGDLVEEVKLIDEFTNKKTNKTSNCFRISYRSNERSLTDDEINGLQARVRECMQNDLLVELR